jgi:hypothetical protein
MFAYVVYVYSGCRKYPEMKTIKVFQDEKMAMEFANHYSIKDGKNYYKGYTIEGTYYDAKFYCYTEGDEYDGEISEKEFNLKVEKSNQFKKELDILDMEDIFIAIDKVPME